MHRDYMDLLQPWALEGTRIRYKELLTASDLRRGDILMGFRAITSASLLLSAGGHSWRLTLAKGETARAIKGVAPYPFICSLYTDLTITEIDGEVVCIYYDLVEEADRQRLCNYKGAIHPGIYVASGMLWFSPIPIQIVDTL